jgi:hypothetical protein
MRHLSFMAALVGVSLVLGPIPALATDQAGAIKICERSGVCNIARGKTGVNISVGPNEIYCPDKGECECIVCGYQTRRTWGRSLGFLLKRFSPPDSIVSGGSSGSSAPVQHAPAPTPQPPIL